MNSSIVVVGTIIMGDKDKHGQTQRTIRPLSSNQMKLYSLNQSNRANICHSWTK